MSTRIAGRCFLVGCPRSGTTLLQTMLGAHPRVYAPWETHFFRKALKRRSWTHRVLALSVQRGARRGLRELIRLTERPDLQHEVPALLSRFPRYADAFVRILDQAALGRGADYWSEKTPQHLYFIDAIRRAVPSARFIHILRDGRDVAASLYDLAHRDPDEWVHQLLPHRSDRAPDGAEQDRRLAVAAARRWNHDRRISLAYHGSPGHLLVDYAALVADPRGELARLTSFLQLDFREEMLRHQEVADDLLRFRADIVGCEQLRQPLRDTHLLKYHRVFDAEQRDLVERHLSQSVPETSSRQPSNPASRASASAGPPSGRPPCDRPETRRGSAG